MDLEKLLGRVNHDLLMQKLSTKIEDGRVFRLIRRYLEAGMMAERIISPRTEGTPQGGSLSPLLSNILLTELESKGGPWWSSGASHLNQAFPKSFSDRLGLVSLLDTMRRLQCAQ